MGVLLGDDVEISVVVVHCEVMIDHFECVGVGDVFEHGEFSVFVVSDWYFFDCESVLCGGVCFVDYAECSLCYNAFQNILSWLILSVCLLGQDLLGFMRFGFAEGEDVRLLETSLAVTVATHRPSVVELRWRGFDSDARTLGSFGHYGRSHRLVLCARARVGCFVHAY